MTEPDAPGDIPTNAPSAAPSWWEALDEQGAVSEDGIPDPWAHTPLPEASLTEDQADFLTGLADQPAPPRIATPDPFADGD